MGHFLSFHSASRTTIPTESKLEDIGGDQRSLLCTLLTEARIHSALLSGFSTGYFTEDNLCCTVRYKASLFSKGSYSPGFEKECQDFLQMIQQDGEPTSMDLQLLDSLCSSDLSNSRHSSLFSTTEYSAGQTACFLPATPSDSIALWTARCC